jgi:hypothetical protein
MAMQVVRMRACSLNGVALPMICNPGVSAHALDAPPM